MTRILTGHIVNPANDKLKIEVLDEPGSGGAHHRYEIEGMDFVANPSWDCGGRYSTKCGAAGVSIIFQQGPIAEAGVNGITHEALLAILIDRLECFQRGPYCNDYNGAALAHLEHAQSHLLARTKERMARGVEGTHKA